MEELTIHLSQAAQITALQQNKVPIKILAKYIDYTHVFSSDLVMKLSEDTSINKYAMKLVKSKQLSYGSIYGFSFIELETLKIYIKTQMKTSFIWSFKSLMGESIFFDKKLNGSFYLSK